MIWFFLAKTLQVGLYFVDLLKTHYGKMVFVTRGAPISWLVSSTTDD